MPMREALRRLAALLLLAWLPALAIAQPADDPPPPRIGVVTMGPGAVFWERFGHDAIVVDDPAQAQPVSYNFGYFDLAEDGFIGRFVRGEMEYMLVALPLEDDLGYYRQVGRGAILQWLDLSPAQARGLAARLVENARPENARYRYDYYTDNCATRVRDALDQALGGLLRNQWKSRSAGNTWRSESVRLASPEPWMWLGFDLGLGPRADAPLSRWQEAFLPRRLADNLRATRLPDGRPLVTEEVVLLPQLQGAEPAERPRSVWPWLLAGLALGGLVLLAAPRAPRTLAGVATGFWLLCGLLGVLMLFLWLGTAHSAGWANRNLLLLSPLCLALLPGAMRLLRGRDPGRVFRGVLLLVVASAAAACLPLWLQPMPQRNGHWLALLLPVHLAFAWAWARRRP
jgi:hypothetical protein